MKTLVQDIWRAQQVFVVRCLFKQLTKFRVMSQAPDTLPLTLVMSNRLRLALISREYIVSAIFESLTYIEVYKHINL